MLGSDESLSCGSLLDACTTPCSLRCNVVQKLSFPDPLGRFRAPQRRHSRDLNYTGYHVCCDQCPATSCCFATSCSTVVCKYAHFDRIWRLLFAEVPTCIVSFMMYSWSSGGMSQSPGISSFVFVMRARVSRGTRPPPVSGGATSTALLRAQSDVANAHAAQVEQVT